jgi:hypothetical protein
MPKQPCVRCGKPGRKVEDPYQADVNNRKVKTVLCTKCYGDLCQEV